MIKSSSRGTPPKFMLFSHSAPLTDRMVSKRLMRNRATKNDAGRTTTMNPVLPTIPFYISLGMSSPFLITPAPSP